MSKCQACGLKDSVWAWQPFGPDESILCFTTEGCHYRGFPVIKICDDCKRDIVKGNPGVVFTYKHQGYFALDGEVKESPF